MRRARKPTSRRTRCHALLFIVLMRRPRCGKTQIGSRPPGAIIGGVLGHQIGGGLGNDVATALGAVGGAAVGANVNRGSETYTQNVERCERVPDRRVASTGT